MTHKTHALASAASWGWYVCEKKSLKTAQKSWHNSVILTVKQKQQASVTLHHHCQNNMSDPKHILHRGKDCQRQGGRGGRWSGARTEALTFLVCCVHRQRTREQRKKGLIYKLSAPGRFTVSQWTGSAPDRAHHSTLLTMTTPPVLFIWSSASFSVYTHLLLLLFEVSHLPVWYINILMNCCTVPMNTYEHTGDNRQRY